MRDRTLPSGGEKGDRSSLYMAQDRGILPSTSRGSLETLKEAFILYIENQRSGERFMPYPPVLQGLFLGIALLTAPWSVRNIPMAG